MVDSKGSRRPLGYFDANNRLHIAIGTKKTATKAAPKAAAKKADAPAPAKRGTKRKANDDEAPAAPVKKVKALVKGPVINEPPTDRLQVFVFGEGTAGELGLGKLLHNGQIDKMMASYIGRCVLISTIALTRTKHETTAATSTLRISILQDKFRWS